MARAKAARARPPAAPTRPVRQIQEQPDVIHELTLDPDDELFLFALEAEGRTCDMCNDPDHFLRECPRFKRLSGNMDAMKRVLAAVRAKVYPNQTPKNTRPLQTRTIRQLDQDDSPPPPVSDSDNDSDFVDAGNQD